MPSYTYAYGANPPIDFPRLLVSDTDVANNPIFADEEIMAASSICSMACAVYPAWGAAGFSQQFGSASPRQVAATLLDSLAANTARLAAMLKVLDVQMDSSKAASALMAQAAALRAADENSSGFAIAEQVLDKFTAVERTWKMMLRTYGGI